jgi:hypothetical protein
VENLGSGPRDQFFAEALQAFPGEKTSAEIALAVLAAPKNLVLRSICRRGGELCGSLSAPARLAAAALFFLSAQDGDQFIYFQF